METSKLCVEPEPLNEQRTIPTAFVLGIRFHALKFDEAVSLIEDFVRQKACCQVCLGNAYTVSLCQKDESLKNATNQAALVLADGMSILWGGKWTGARIPERIAGPDLMRALCARSNDVGYRICLFGSNTDNLNLLESVLKAEFPNLIVAGKYSPSFCERIDDNENGKIFEFLEKARPDILFVGMSAPKQEKWIAENLQRLNIPVSIGVGAAFDFLSGKIPRAPLWLRKCGLEWLYRLYCEPRRLWKRYLLGNTIFVFCSLREAVTTRSRKLLSS